MLFTSKLANQGVRKALFISVVSTNTYDTAYAHVFRPLLSPLLHLNASLSGAEWSGQASVVQFSPLPSPALPCPMHLTLDNPLFMGTLSNQQQKET